MQAGDFIGISFVLGILGIGVSFVTIYMKNNSNLCERITKLENIVENLTKMIESLRNDRDKFHPRK